MKTCSSYNMFQKGHSNHFFTLIICTLRKISITLHFNYV